MEFFKEIDNISTVIQVLGSGFEVITVGKRKLVRSVPTELKKDHNEILKLSQVSFITSESIPSTPAFLCHQKEVF